LYCTHLINPHRRHVNIINGMTLKRTSGVQGLNSEPPAIFLFFAFRKSVQFKIVLPLKIYQNEKCHGPTLTGASFESTSEV
jgi:hypothetical protein